MSASCCCRGHRPGLLSTLAFAAALSALVSPVLADGIPAAASPTQGTADTVTVHVDQAKIMKLPERTSTLVVGNPLIADAVVQPGGVVVITAKSYGATNLVALDRLGTALVSYSVQVVGPSDPVVVVYRGIERETYSCAPKCERRITIGDTTAYFTGQLTQVSSFGQQVGAPAR